jgi:hypothetical protein
MGGVVYPACEKIAQKAVDTGWDGMSHGFITLQMEKEQGLIEQYRIFEASTLPAKYAANVWTGLDLIQEKDVMSQKREDLVALLGVDLVDEIEKETGSLEELLTQEGVESKEKEEESPEEEAPEEEAVSEEEEVEATSEEEAESEVEAEEEVDPQKALVMATAEVVVKALDIPGLNAVLKELTGDVGEIKGQIKELAKSEDEKLDEKMAEQYEEPLGLMWEGRASDSKETEVDPDDTKDAELLATPPSANGQDESVFNLFFNE